MDRHKHEELNDELLEREIESALDVDPSPEFLARVRTRVASERIAEGWAWHSGWRVTGVALTAVTVVVIGMWMAGGPVPAPPQRQVAGAPRENVAPQPRIPESEPASGVITLSNVSKPVMPARPSPVAQPRLTQAELLISQDEAAALRRLFTAISNGRFDTAVIPDLEAALQPPSEIEAIVVEPLILKPLAALESE